jgi:Tol biopolymer transport system component
MPIRCVLFAWTALFFGACTADPNGPAAESASQTLASGKPRPSPPANPEIAWSKDGIWVMNADGSNQARVTPPDGWIGNPAWSPLVGESPSYQLAYSDIDTDTLWIVDISVVSGVPRGSAPRVLTTGGREPSWSPLGDEIAYLRPGPEGGAGIWTTDTAGTTRTRVYEPPAEEGRTFMRPAWRSDGLALAFWEDRSPSSPDYKKIQVVTRASRTAPWSDTVTTVYLDPDAPAGSSLDWARTKNVLVFTDNQYAGAPIELLDLDSRSVKTVGIGLRPSWSPDDRYLVYYGRRGAVTKLELATGALTALARESGCCRPDWRRPEPAP